MPFEMECAHSIARMYWGSSHEVRKTVDEALDRIASRPTIGSPKLNGVRLPLGLRLYRFRGGVLVYRYVRRRKRDTRVEILIWGSARSSRY